MTIKKKTGPKILLLDIETAPILASVWGLFDQTIPLSMIQTDWHLLAVACKWLNDSPKKIMYKDQRKAKNIEDDTEILKMVWKLLDESDVVLTQNGISFDLKKLNARFALNGMGPPSPYRQIDTKRISKKYFAFTSNKLEYLTENLCKKYKKLKHSKFSGFELWKQCIAGNQKAWKEMEKYNKYDVLSLEELYNVLQPWDNSINFNIFFDNIKNNCNCGSIYLEKRGFNYTNTGRFQRFQCKSCGTWTSSKVNLLSKEKRDGLRGKE